MGDVNPVGNMQFSQIFVDSQSSSCEHENKTDNFIEAMERGYMVDGMELKAEEVSDALRASGIIKVNRRNSLLTADEVTLGNKTDMTRSVRNSAIVVQDSAMTVRRSKKKTEALKQAEKLKSSTNVEQEETAPESDSEFEAKSDNKLLTLPEIRGDKKMKDVRLALLNDLHNDGLVKRNVPFSSTRKFDTKSPSVNRITQGDIPGSLKEAVKTFIMKNDPSVKKLPSVKDGVTSPEPEKASRTMSDQKPLLYYSDSKFGGLSQKSSMLTINQRNLLLRNAQRSPSDVIQEENFEKMWSPDKFVITEKNKRR